MNAPTTPPAGNGEDNLPTLVIKIDAAGNLQFSSNVPNGITMYGMLQRATDLVRQSMDKPKTIVPARGFVPGVH